MSFPEKSFKEAVTQGRLLARPTQPSETTPLGLQPLRLSGERDGLLYIPAGYRVDKPAPLVLMLHGAGNNARVVLFHKG